MFIILYIKLCSLNVLINIHAIIFAVQKKTNPDVLRCTYSKHINILIIF